MDTARSVYESERRVVLAAAVAGRGSVDAEQEAVNPLAQAVSATQSENSARMTMQTTGEVAGQILKGNGSGAVQFKPPRARPELQRQRGRPVVRDRRGARRDDALHKAAQGGEVRHPGRESWIKLDLDKPSGGAFYGVSSQSQGSAAQLKRLSELAGTKAVSKETIDFIQTAHYHGEVDYSDFGADTSAIKRPGGIGHVRRHRG